MSSFETIAFDLSVAEAELADFKAWLSGRGFVGETAIVAEIKKRPQMACLLGSVLNIPVPDLIRFELTMKGIFRTDLALGNDHFREFALIEFEPAEEASLFKKGTAQYRYWGSALEHGFGQVVDWAWVRADHPDDTLLENTFGGPIAKSAYALVVGRDDGIVGPMERKRFEHRRNLLTIGGVPAQIMTYDDMVKRMELTLATLGTYT